MNELSNLKSKYQSGAIGYGHAKAELLATFKSYFHNQKQRFESYLSDPLSLDRQLTESSNTLKEKATQRLASIKKGSWFLMISTYLTLMIISACTMFFATKLAIFLSRKINFYDFPSKRKSHLKPTPILGGMALMMTILINIFMFAKFELSPFTVGLIGSIGIFLIGLCDDKFNIRPITKIIGQSVINIRSIFSWN